jgi:hypothetical protein
VTSRMNIPTAASMTIATRTASGTASDEVTEGHSVELVHHRRGVVATLSGVSGMRFSAPARSGAHCTVSTTTILVALASPSSRA